METLANLFGGMAKLKLVKLFVFNPEWQLGKDDLMQRSKLSQGEMRRTVNILKKCGLVKERKMWTEGSNGKKRVAGYSLNPDFEYLEQLRHFLLTTASVDDKEIIQRISKAGRLRLVVTAGVFLHDWDGRVDLMVVGDNLRMNVVENAIRSIEADMGRELKYVIFETDDFKYRYGLYDKLIRDIIDFSHYVVLDKIGLSMGVGETSKTVEV